MKKGTQRINLIIFQTIQYHIPNSSVLSCVDHNKVSTNKNIYIDTLEIVKVMRIILNRDKEWFKLLCKQFDIFRCWIAETIKISLRMLAQFSSFFTKYSQKKC